MILIVGGEGSGKRSFAKSLGYSDADMADAALNDCPVVFHTERMVMEQMDAVDALFEALRRKQVVICNEVGSGIIPMTQHERRWRESTGRLCVRLAGEADAVVRMVCGIPSVIKGEL